jgi:membrane-associated phospholipid phosphatase
MFKQILLNALFLRVSLNALFKNRDQALYHNRDGDKAILFVSAALFVLAYILYVSGGYHMGFLTLQSYSHWLLPASAWANITFVGDTMVSLTIALFFSYRYPKIVIAVFISASVGTVMIQGMKHAFDLGRPLTVYSSDMLQLIGPAYKKNAFPSGHTATAFILAGILFRCTKNRGSRQGIMLFAILVGLSRVACGVHWPIDVAVGAGIGLLSAWIGIRLSDYWRVGLNTYAALSTLFVTAAYMLIRYDGGFESTGYFAQVLGITALLYWTFCWGLTLLSFNTRLARWLQVRG